MAHKTIALTTELREPNKDMVFETDSRRDGGKGRGLSTECIVSLASISSSTSETVV